MPKNPRGLFGGTHEPRVRTPLTPADLEAQKAKLDKMERDYRDVARPAKDGERPA